eukprot:m.134053 g.134053  ORF g.134053 m.134053 type:complete len:137 (+) comp13107_c0_seq4:614-1024(+)
MKKIPTKVRQFEFRHKQPGKVFIKYRSDEDAFQEIPLNVNYLVTNEVFSHLKDYVVPTERLPDVRIRQLEEIRDKFIIGEGFEEHAMDFFDERSPSNSRRRRRRRRRSRRIIYELICLVIIINYCVIFVFFKAILF